MNRKMIAAAAGTLALAAAGPALAQLPVDGGIGMQPAASGLAEQVHVFHNLILMPIITVICLLVLALLVWVIVRYNAKANPVPRKFSHNTLVEVIWTGVPILILLFIALPSFELLYAEDVIPDGKQVAVSVGDPRLVEIDNDFPEGRRITGSGHVRVLSVRDGEFEVLKRGEDYEIEGLGEPVVTVTLANAPAQGETVLVQGGRSMVGPGKFLGLFGEDRRRIAQAPSVTIKAIGYQWQWAYAYPDYGDFSFFSQMAPESATTPELYRLEVDNRMVVPVGETIRIVTTASDVIHSWAVPAFAIKIDAVPGRLNETWFQADREGVYYGQCSEICGVKHAFMPIAVEVVSRDRFEAWVDEQRALAGLDPMFADSVKFAEAPASASNQ